MHASFHYLEGNDNSVSGGPATEIWEGVYFWRENGNGVVKVLPVMDRQMDERN